MVSPMLKFRCQDFDGLAFKMCSNVKKAHTPGEIFKRDKCPTVTMISHFTRNSWSLLVTVYILLSLYEILLFYSLQMPTDPEPSSG